MSDFETIELSIEEAKNLIARRDKLNKLTSNREFKALVLDGYFKDEAVRLVAISAEPSMAQYRDDIQEAIRAISFFQQYLRQISQFGDMAERDLAAAEYELQEARAEAAFENAEG